MSEREELWTAELRTSNNRKSYWRGLGRMNGYSITKSDSSLIYDIWGRDGHIDLSSSLENSLKIAEAHHRLEQEG